MITEAFLQMIHGMASALLSALHALVPAPPGFWSDATTYVNTLFDGALAPVRYFLPIGPAMIIAAALMALFVASIALKLLRLVFSFLTGGGGGIGV